MGIAEILSGKRVSVGEMLAQIDSIRRGLGSNISSLLADPAGHFGRSAARYGEENLPTRSDMSDYRSVMPQVRSEAEQKIMNLAMGMAGTTNVIKFPNVAMNNFHTSAKKMRDYMQAVGLDVPNFYTSKKIEPQLIWGAIDQQLGMDPAISRLSESTKAVGRKIWDEFDNSFKALKEVNSDPP